MRLVLTTLVLTLLCAKVNGSSLSPDNVLFLQGHTEAKDILTMSEEELQEAGIEPFKENVVILSLGEPASWITGAIYKKNTEYEEFYLSPHSEFSGIALLDKDASDLPAKTHAPVTLSETPTQQGVSRSYTINDIAITSNYVFAAPCGDDENSSTAKAELTLTANGQELLTLMGYDDDVAINKANRLDLSDGSSHFFLGAPPITFSQNLSGRTVVSQHYVEVSCEMFRRLNVDAGKYVGVNYVGDLNDDNIPDLILYQGEKSCYEQFIYLGNMDNGVYGLTLLKSDGGCGV